MGHVLMHQGMGLDAFNALPERKAVHALYECCNSVVLARDLARGRAYADHDALFRRADALLFSLGDEVVEQIHDTCPHVGRRPGSTRSSAEQCSVWVDDTAVMGDLNDAVREYSARFDKGFVMFVCGLDIADVRSAISDRMHNDAETERKVVRNELAKINRSRLERMLGPEGGYHNW
jgi:2-oxo-4-hydroxy-4-carboxy-5-ureidoimidazoline decarboxylase